MAKQKWPTNGSNFDNRRIDGIPASPSNSKDDVMVSYLPALTNCVVPIDFVRHGRKLKVVGA